METRERGADTSTCQKVVQVELIVQTRQNDTDPWYNQGRPYPAVDEKAARAYLKLIRTGYPGLKSQLIERSVIYSDRIVEA